MSLSWKLDNKLFLITVLIFLESSSWICTNEFHISVDTWWVENYVRIEICEMRNFDTFLYLQELLQSKWEKWRQYSFVNVNLSNFSLVLLLLIQIRVYLRPMNSKKCSHVETKNTNILFRVSISTKVTPNYMFFEKLVCKYQFRALVQICSRNSESKLILQLFGIFISSKLIVSWLILKLLFILNIATLEMNTPSDIFHETVELSAEINSNLYVCTLYCVRKISVEGFSSRGHHCSYITGNSSIFPELLEK